jgi:MFS family permease
MFGVLSLSSGAFYWGVTALLVPYLLRKHGVAVNEISEVAAIASLPNIWGFLTSPVIDLGFKRRTWVLLCVGLTGVCGWFAIAGISGSIPLLTALLFAGNVLVTMAQSAMGALMSTVDTSVRGRAGGWFQAGNIGGGSLVGGSLIWLSDRVSLPLLALAGVVTVCGPALIVFLIRELPIVRLTAKASFTALFEDMRLFLTSRRTWLGLAFFCSPIGTGALSNLISSVGVDYNASGDLVAFVTGVGGAILMGIGCALGGLICDRVHRKTCYAGFGLLGAAAAAYLGLAHHTAFTYASGYAVYAFAIGLNFAAYSALILEVLGSRARGAATGFALLSSSGNISLIYMTWLDGLGYRAGGAQGLMLTEALVGGTGAIVFLFIARHAIRRWPHLTDVPVAVAAK